MEFHDRQVVLAVLLDKHEPPVWLLPYLSSAPHSIFDEIPCIRKTYAPDVFAVAAFQWILTEAWRLDSRPLSEALSALGPLADTLLSSTPKSMFAFRCPHKVMLMLFQQVRV